MGSGLVVLDVDGVVSPLPRHGAGRAPVPAWDDLAQLASTRMEMLVSARMAARLAALPAQRVWLSSWGRQANAVVAAGLGWDEIPVVEPVPTDGRSAVGAKLWALERFVAGLGDEPEALVWLDDDLGEHRQAQVWASGLGFPALLLSPDRFVGVTPADLTLVEEFLAAAARTAPGAHPPDAAGP